VNEPHDDDPAVAADRVDQDDEIREIGQDDRLAILEHGPELVLGIDDDYRIRYANQAAVDVLGYLPEQYLGTSVLEFIHPDDLAYAARAMEARNRAPGRIGLTIQLRGRDASGAWRVADVVGRRMAVADGPDLLVVSMRFVDNKPALGSDPPRLRSLIDKTSDIILLLEPDGTVLFANGTVTRTLGHDCDRLVQESWLQLVDEPDRQAATDVLAELVAGDVREAQARLHLVDSDGVGVVHSLRFVDQHDDPLVAGIIVSARDITDLAAVEDKLRRQNELLTYEATHDHVTGLVNRAEFRRLVDLALARRDADVTVLFCDLDGFKRVNDRFGHDTGDRVLREIARRLRDAVRRGDVAARWGGDEFTVLCEGPVDADEVTALRARLRSAIGAPLAIDGGEVEIGVSLGVARHGPADRGLDDDGGGRGDGPGSARRGVPEVDADALVDRADRAMYADKRRHA